MRKTPNFAHARALILHRPDSNTEKLVRQLKLFGLSVEIAWEPLQDGAIPDLLIVDADQGWHGLLPWHEADGVPCPLIVLLGSEAPSRIEWALDVGAGAVLAKPINTAAIYPALVMAHARHAERIKTREKILHLEERLRLRPVVNGAVGLLMKIRNIDEATAYAALRSEAMRKRCAVEIVAADFLAGKCDLPEVG